MHESGGTRKGNAGEQDYPGNGQYHSEGKAGVYGPGQISAWASGREYQENS